MSWPRRMAITTIAFAFWVGAMVFAQSEKTATKEVASSWVQRVEERRAFLLAQEQRRREIANELEFSARAPSRPSPLPQICLLPPPISAAIDPHRSLFVHDYATFTPPAGRDFSLGRTLNHIAAQVAQRVPGTTGATIFRQFWDTQNDASSAEVPSSPHCSDNGNPINGYTINGYPIQCPRQEGWLAQGDVDATINTYRVVALVNRLDLAHHGWRNCGEFRIIYATGSGGNNTNFIIFEAVLPNPKPGCREACLPIAEFWASLSGIDDLPTRAQMLETFYYYGLPGFRPVVHVDHYSAGGVSGAYGSSGSGQIRTNQFIQSPWTLREFKTVIDCATTPCTFNIVPIMVKMNPFPLLWDENDGHPNGANFRADTVAQLNRLSSGDLMQIGYEVELRHDDGESVQLPSDNYREHIDDQGTFAASLAGNSLTADHIANRALAQSCHGCHRPSNFDLTVPDSIGMVTTPSGSSPPTIDYWPDALTFSHVAPQASIRPELGNQVGYRLSPALMQFFLPHRLNFLVAQLNATRCTCVRRFHFVPPNERRRALAIEAKVDARFARRLEELARKSEQLEVEPSNDAAKQRAQLLETRAQIFAERDRLLASEFAKGGIKFPDEEMLDLRPTSLKLSVSTAERTKAVNDLVKKEPPRRTVTGTFRSH